MVALVTPEVDGLSALPVSTYDDSTQARASLQQGMRIRGLNVRNDGLSSWRLPRLRITPIRRINWLLPALLCCVSCSPGLEPISSYQVEKHETIQIPLEEEASPTSLEPMIDPTDRILGATILMSGEKVAWYIKGAAPIASWPDDADEQFDKFLTTLRFEDPKKPSWELSDRWIEQPGSSSMRAADLVLGDVTFSVIKLPITPGETDRQYLLMNMNRWRNQLSLGPITSAQLASTSHKITTADGKSATVVNYLGKKDASSMPPMMHQGMAGGGPVQRSIHGSGSSSKAKKQETTETGFSSSPPESWEKTKTRMFQLERYIVKSGDQTGYASISQAGGDFLMNANRWRGQVGLPSIEQEDDTDPELIKVSGIESVLLRMLGEERGIVVAMVPMNSGQNWFFKLEGPASLVESEADSFRKYLETVKIK